MWHHWADLCKHVRPSSWNCSDSLIPLSLSSAQSPADATYLPFQPPAFPYGEPVVYSGYLVCWSNSTELIDGFGAPLPSNSAIDASKGPVFMATPGVCFRMLVTNTPVLSPLTRMFARACRQFPGVRSVYRRVSHLCVWWFTSVVLGL